MNLHAVLAANCVTHADERLSRYTTFQLGGPCPLMIFCQTPEQLAVTVAELHSVHQKFFVMGGGSNLLVADAGVPVVVVRYLGDQPDIRHTAGVVEVSGATLLDDAVAFTVAQGLAGFTFASGIPGTIGGALAGNAGAFGQQIGDIVEAVTLLDRTGRTRTASRADMRFAYRSSGLSDSVEMVVAADGSTKVTQVTTRETVVQPPDETGITPATGPVAGSAAGPGDPAGEPASGA